jgi:hypothetical protein
MNATSNPKPSSGSSDLVIHPQCNNGGSSASCAAHELGAIVTPAKMTKPTVAPRVKELYSTPGLWVSSSGLPGLELAKRLVAAQADRKPRLERSAVPEDQAEYRRQPVLRELRSLERLTFLLFLTAYFNVSRLI